MAIFSYTSTQNAFISLSIASYASVSYSYNEYSDSYFVSIDLGQITDSIFESEDFGSVSENFSLIDDYGFNIGSNKPVFGTLGKFNSNVKYSLTRADEIKGVTFLFNGNSKSYINASYIGYSSQRISGGLTSEKNTESYVSSGSLFGFGSTAERIVVSYNNSSVVFYNVDDFGLITSPEDSFIDYGEGLGIPSGGDDFGLIGGVARRPFGFSRLTGIPNIIVTLNYIGSGSLFAFSSATEAFGPNPPENTALFKFAGGYSNLKNTESYVGTGSLFAFSGGTEVSGVNPPSSGLFKFSGAATQSITPTSEIGSGSLFTVIGAAESFGANPPENTALFKFAGAVVEKNTENYVGSGSIFTFLSGTEVSAVKPPTSGLFRISGTVISKASLLHVGSGRPTIQGTARIFTKPSHTGFGFINIDGGYSNLKNTESYVGTGKLFGFGTKLERTSVSYNQSSVVKFIGEDYGNLTSITEIVDYGYIFNEPSLPSDREDYGLISGTGRRPFGFSRFSGAVVEKNTENYVGTGSLFAFSSTTEAFGPNPPENTALFKFAGGYTNLKNTESYVGTGSLFAFSSTTEAFGPKPPISGLFKFSGAVVEKNTENYVGTGSLFAFSSTTEAFGPNPPENTALFKFAGAATQRITPATVVSVGKLFGFGSKVESTAVSYNDSSTVDFEDLDFGLITSPEDSFIDYGEGLGIPSGGDDFGLIGGVARRPFGFSRLTGIPNIIVTLNYIGSGSLFTFSSTTESFGKKLPASGLFRVSGSAAESYVPSTEIGSGTLAVYQKTQVLDPEDKVRLASASERIRFEEFAEPESIRLRGRVGIYFQFRETGSGLLRVNGRVLITLKPIHIGEGQFTINGAAAPSIAPAPEIGSGSLFGFSSSAESFGPNPQENTALFKFTGSAIQKNTESYVGIGNERVTGTPLVIIKLRYIGSGGTSLTSSTTEARRYIHEGSGSLFGFVSASSYLASVIKLELLILKISGSAVERNTESYVGSGSVFSFISAAESFGANPPENTALFKFNGSSKSRTQPVYIGKGSINVSEGSGRPDKNNKTFIVSSEESLAFRTTEEPISIKISGSSVYSRPSVYKGKGSLFGFGGKAESVSFSPDDTRELFKVSGTAAEKGVRNYIGEGSIFSIAGSSYSLTKRPKETTTLFNVNGSANEAFAEGNYDASGSFFTNIQSKTKTSFSPKSTTTLFQFVGSSKEKNTEVYYGSGSIGILISTGKSVFYDYKISQKAFKLFGNTFESFAKSNYDGFAAANIDAYSQNRKINYVPPKRSRVIII